MKLKTIFWLAVLSAAPHTAGAIPAFDPAFPEGHPYSDVHQEYTAEGGSLIASEFVVGPTSPGIWPSAGGTTTVTWSLMATGLSCAAESAGCTTTALSSFMPAGFLTEIQNAFSAWSSVANLTFVQTSDCGLSFNSSLCAGGDIRFAGHVFDGAGGTLAHGYYPPVNGSTAAGDIHFDIADTWKIGFGGSGFSIFQVTAHEIGHALGLDHTSVASSLMNAFYTEAFSGPQADDIAGMQFLYGAPVSTVPLPGSVWLFGTGLAALIGLRRRSPRRSR